MPWCVNKCHRMIYISPWRIVSVDVSQRLYSTTRICSWKVSMLSPGHCSHLSARVRRWISTDLSVSSCPGAPHRQHRSPSRQGPGLSPVSEPRVRSALRMRQPGQKHWWARDMHSRWLSYVSSHQDIQPEFMISEHWLNIKHGPPVILSRFLPLLPSDGDLWSLYWFLASRHNHDQI